MGECYRFTVNGQEVVTEKKASMLRFLRDDLKLYSVKDGCSQGACGACMILADGKPVRSCVLKTQKASGMKLLTVEGLSVPEKEAFVYAFGTSGAVQCGFCTPGMVMSAKALLDVNPDPSDDQIKDAVKGNICRCTGYQKIIEGIRLAGAILRGEEKIDRSREEGEDYGVGRPAFRVDVRRKTLGYGKYPDDIGPEYFIREGSERALELEKAFSQAGDQAALALSGAVFGSGRHLKAGSVICRADDPGCTLCTIVDPDLPDMAYCGAVRSRYARARILKIDTSKAKSLPGVLGVLTAKDVPVNKVGHIIYDWDVMIEEGSVTHMCGDAICLVVAESPYLLEKAKELVEIEYEILPVVRTPEEAARSDAPLLHPGGNLCESRHIVRGNPKEALARSKYVVTEQFETPFTEHAFLEPECAVSFPYKSGIKILSTDQGAYATRKETAHMLGWEEDRVVVENQLIGGGFGGKEDVSVQHLSALAAWIFRRPVKMKLSRQESIEFHPKRHAMKGTFTLGCDENGILQAIDCEFTFDTGAYASLCGPVLERACTHAVGPYCYQNTDIRGYGYYTNNPPAGAFRGFGVCQTEFAVESVLNLLAEKVGISPWEIRYRNAIEPGKVLPNGQIADVSTALKEALLAVRPYYEQNPGRAGIACAMKNAGVGVGLPDDGNARLVVKNGTVVIYTCASDIGQGGYTVFCQDTAQATGLPKGRLLMGICNTENAPDSGMTSGSRQTLVTGEAVRGAAFLLRDAMTAAQIVLDRMESGYGEGISYKDPDQLKEVQNEILSLLKGSEACLHPRISPEDTVSYGNGTQYAPGTLKGPFVSLNMKIAEDGSISGQGSGIDQGTYGRRGSQTRISGCPVKDPDRVLGFLEGMRFSYRYFEPTDPLGADVPYPKSHIAYAYAACCAVLDDDGRVEEIYSAYDAGKVVNPIAIQGQIEGGILMGMGYACTEHFPLEECRPKGKFGTLGLLRAPQIPKIKAILVEKEELMGVSYGSKGIGEITTIPAAPAIAGAYYAKDHKLRRKLPMDHTFYRP